MRGIDLPCLRAGLVPVLTMALVLGVGCEGARKDAQRRRLLAMMDASGAVTPAEFPKGIPTLPGLRVADLSTSPIVALTGFTEASVEDTTAHYRAAFNAAGWETAEEAPTTEQGVLMHNYVETKGEQTVMWCVGHLDATGLSMLSMFCRNTEPMEGLVSYPQMPTGMPLSMMP